MGGVRGTMGSIFLSNEELGKKDDDHRPAKVPPMRAQWSAAGRAPPRKTLRRLAVVLVLGVFVYLFIKNLPTDVPIRDRRRPVYRPAPEADARPTRGPVPKLTPDPEPDRSSAPPPPEPQAPAAGYNGPATYRKLAATLQAISSTSGSSPSNKNVLFAAANLKSAALLLPLACQMAAELKSYVHFALMGGSEIDIRELRAVNGIGDSCQVIFHDARPDFAAISTIERLRRSAGRALFHINTFMHPQAMLVDASGVEDDYFLAAIRKQAPILNIPLIELPENAHSRLGWLTKLDSSSLGAWDKISIEILIHASPGVSGSLIRLLKSLSAADFSAGSVPHLTIELPHDVDRATAEFLKKFQWPPGRSHMPSRPRQLTLKRRISRSRLAEEESSVRFLESFWPASPKYSHVLVLTPQAQLSPQFFHCKEPPHGRLCRIPLKIASPDLKYAVLEYLYSGTAATQQWDSRLLGISLDLPSTYLNASEPFAAPSGTPESKAGEHTSFLWQAPNSNAALYTGQKWIELHALVSNLLDFQQRAENVPTLLAEKLVSKRYPAWLEHALKLARARGYWMLYPSEQTAANLATVHNELYRAPEEYVNEMARDEAQDAERAISGGTLLESLPGGGSLLPFSQMPLLMWDGTVTDLTKLDEAAAGYANDFRHAVGGCEALAPEDLAPKKSMKDLFCLKDE